MLKWLAKNKWLALGLVAIMLFTLLPTNLNWADISVKEPEKAETEALPTEEEEVLTEATTEKAPDTETVTSEAVSSEVSEGPVAETEITTEVQEEGTSSEETVAAVESTDGSTLTEEDSSNEVQNNADTKETKTMGAADSDITPMDYTITDKGSLGSYITSAKILHSDDSEVTAQNPALPNETIYIDYKFDLSQVELHPGDRYTITIPQEYCHLVTVTDEPLIYDGVEIGTYSISSDGVVSITFNDNITNKQGVTGEFWVGCKLEEDKIKDQDKIEIDVTDGKKPPADIDIFQQSKIPEIKKTSSTNALGEIVWTIEIIKNGADLEGAVLSDHLQYGQIIQGMRVWAQKNWQNVNVDGACIPDWKGSDFTLDFIKDIDADHIYVEIRSKLPDDQKPGEDQSLTIPNTAELTVDDKKYPADATYTYTTNRVEKSGSYDKKTGEITWTITVNKNKESLENVKVIDEFLKDHPEYEQVGDITISPSTSKAGASAKSFPVELGDIEGTYTITFKTKHKDGDSLDGTITNETKVDMDNFESATAKGTVSNEIGDYAQKSGSYNWGTKKIDWTVTINQDYQDMTNGKLTDTIVSGHVLDKESFKITVTKSNGSRVEYTADTWPGTITLTDDGFVVTLPSPTTDKYVITYSTSIDASVTGESVNGKEFVNKAHYELKEKPKGEDVTSSVTVWDNMTLFRKVAGGYDYNSNQIEWEIYINENNAVLMGENTIDDVIGANQKFVKGSLVVEKWVGGAEWEGGHWEEVSGYTAFPVKLKDIREKYRITYRTEVDTSKWPETGDSVTYTNKATMDTDDGVHLEKDAQIDVKLPGLKKSGTITKNKVDQPEITWYIDINRKKQTLAAGVLQDTLDMALELLEGTIALYEVAELNEDGSVKTLGNKVTLGDAAAGATWSYSYNTMTHYFEIHLPTNTKKTYQLQYTTKVTDRSKSVSNKANFQGESPTDESQSTVGGLESSLNGAVVTYLYANLEIIKTAADDGRPLEGVIFALYDNTGKRLGTLNPTDKNGRTFFEGVIVGRTYTIVEEKTQDGYKLDGVARTFKVEYENQTITYEIPNEPESTKGEIEIYKHDDASPSQPVKGAVFGLWYAGNTDKNKPDLKATTDANGIAHFYDVELDIDYTIEEISAPSGYTKSAVSKSGKLTDTKKTISYEFTNVREIGKLRVKKVDQDKTPLSKVTLALYKKGATEAQDVYIGSKTTNGDGYITFTDLEYGEYYLIEPNVPDGYKIGANAKLGRTNSFTISSNTQVEWTVTNTAITGKIVVQKVDVVDSTKKLAGAEFTLWSVDADGTKTLVKKVTTDTSGKAEFGPLALGTYFVKETKAPDGYILNDANERTITITGKETTAANGSVVVGADGNVTYTYTYTNAEQNAKIEFYKQDQRGEPLSTGITFTLYDEYGKKVIATASPDKNGKVVFEKLKWGTYILRETKAPNQYNRYPDDIVIKIDKNGTFGLPSDIIDDNIVVNTDKVPPFISFKFRKTDNLGSELADVVFVARAGENGPVVATAISDENGWVFFQKVEVGENTDYPVNTDLYIYESVSKAGYQRKTEPIAVIKYTEFEGVYSDPKGDITLELAEDVLGGEPVENEPIIGRLQITKTETGTTKLVTGAEYGLYTDKDCNTLFTQAGLVNPAATTNGVITFGNLPFGTYYVKETKAADGYYLDEEVYEVVISKHYVENDKTTLKELSVTDDKIYGTIILSKRDEASNALLTGAEFGLYTKENNTYKEVSSSNYKLTVNGGVYTFRNLEYGKEYYVKELTPPKGYEKPQADRYIGPLSFTEENSYTASETVTNKRITGKLRIEKYDTNENLLEGAEFTLTYPDGTTQSAITDSNGIAVFNDIPYPSEGQVYKVKETRAPNGYVEDPETYEITQSDFEAMQDDVIKTLTITNENRKAQIKITKSDRNTAALLQGAVFDLYAWEGDAETGAYGVKPIATATTNRLGVAVFNLKDTTTVKKYKAVEKASPEGYCLSKNTFFEFIMLENVTEYTWDVTNTKVLAPIRVTKQDRKTGKKLEGAEFTLYDANREFIARKTTGPSGYVQFDNIEAGSYWIQETKAPDGYDNNYTDASRTELIWYPVVIKDGSGGEVVLNDRTYTVLAENDKLPDGKITIEKTDSEDGAKLAGAEFTIYQEDGSPVADYSPATVKTDKDGLASFENLPYGTYVIKETKAPDGYEEATVEEKVTISEASEDTKVVTVPVKNTLSVEQTGTVTVTKVDSADSSVVLGGAEFTIYDANNNAVKTITTDQTIGKASAVLPYGSYTMVETKAPDGYELADNRYSFTISETEKEFNYTAKNTLVTSATIRIYKTDSENEEPLEGAVFGLYQDDKQIAEGSSDENGIIEFTGLSAGTYIIKEIEAPDGYVISESARQVNITGNEVYEYAFENTPEDIDEDEDDDDDEDEDDDDEDEDSTGKKTTSKKTGDEAPIAMAGILLFLSLTGAGVTVAIRRRKRK